MPLGLGKMPEGPAGDRTRPGRPQGDCRLEHLEAGLGFGRPLLGHCQQHEEGADQPSFAFLWSADMSACTASKPLRMHCS